LLAQSASDSPAAQQQQAGENQPDQPRQRFDRGRRGFDGPPGTPQDFRRGDGRERGPGGDFGGPMMRGLGQQMMEPEFLRRDMPLFVQTLDLDESQRPILETLLMDYSDAFTEAAESMREQFAGLRPRTPEQEARSQQRREIGQQMREAVQQLRELRQSTPEGEEPDPAKTDDIRQQMENLQ
jgi:hypothetical protein